MSRLTASRRSGSQVVTITTLGQPESRLPRRRIGVGGALAAGLALLVVYAVVSLVAHVVAATILWIPAILAAGYVSAFARRRGIVGLPRVLVGVLVLVAVHIALISLF